MLAQTGRTDRPTVAVVGAGISGLTAAYLLRRTHDVTLFEAADRLGGHAHTHDVVDSAGRGHAVDSGFIVHNDVTYPWLRKLFTELGVETQPTEMSMSVACEGCGLEYAGGRGVRGLFAQPRRLADPRYLGMLGQVRRFHRLASELLRTGADDDMTTYGEFLEREAFSDYFIAHYAVPVVSCVWSSGRESALLYPARYLFRFLDHHGMLRIGGSPRWYSVLGGSRTYVSRIGALLADVRSGRAVQDVTRYDDRVEIRDAADEISLFDRVVIATHADQALALLTNPSDDEVTTLKNFSYSSNVTVLHKSDSLLPAARGARASWNYRMTQCGRRDEPVLVTYWMNQLHQMDSPDNFLVTLNGARRVDPESVVAEMHYEHPIYTSESVSAQARLGGLNTARTAYAGAYHGWGFHEDGCRSGVDAARHFGVTW